MGEELTLQSTENNTLRQHQKLMLHMDSQDTQQALQMSYNKCLMP